MLLLVTRHRLLRLEGKGLEALPTEGFLNEEGRPRYERLFQALKKLGQGAYIGLGPEHAILRLQPFPNLEGFPLEEAVLAEAERSPLFAGEELTVDYLLTTPEDERRVRVLYTAMPKKGASLLGRLRPSRLEPLPLLLWRYALRQSKAQTLLVLENLAHTVAFFEGGVLKGFRYLTLEADAGTEALAEEIARSLALFGCTGHLEEAWLLGLPTPPPLPPGLPAERIHQEVPKNLETLAPAQELSLELKPKRRPLGEGLPQEAQLAVFLASLLFVLGLLGQSLLTQMIAREMSHLEGLRREAALLREQAFQPAQPQGLGLEEILKVAVEKPESLWLTRLEAEEGRLFLEGKALNPYAPLLLAQRLGGKVGPLERESVDGRALYAWEVEVAKAQAR
ncbi:MAG: hypothetical protein NZ849_06300 [Meiothermus sp.]|uniref:hypothetical protein n=1 Tax=Meiothermus sp. TaxID=1955249 RepID=UPI0025D89049|nr:hypothetical protein [Meiothermus sp.]MCS7194509.1 hypothetical protein [Meiothermus sp.]MDW8480892.1 hypothetical protein [Meiothermus sp.]